MATIAKKCSVCGALYRAYNYVDIPVSRDDDDDDQEYDDDEAIDVEVEEDFEPINFEPNGFEFVTIKEDMDIQYDFDNNDLCPECMTIFENFVTGKIPSASGNPVVLEDAAPVNAVSVEATGGDENTTITRVGKNLLPRTYETSTNNGVTFEVQDDGSIIANGTATSSNASIVILNDTQLDFGQSVIMSGCPSGGSSTTYRTYVREISGGSYKYDTGSGITITSGKVYRVEFVIVRGQTVSNFVIKPMIRYASIENGSFEPYLEKTYSVGDDIRLLTGSNTLTASEGTLTIKYKKAIEGKMEVEP